MEKEEKRADQENDTEEQSTDVLCNRCDQLDQYCESGTYRGKTDTKQ